MSSYEVRCYHCNVSFPPGTKRCLHCGERTGTEPPVQLLDAEALQQVPRPIDPTDVEEEEAPLRRGPARLLVGAMWVVLALVASLYRACTG